MAGSIDAYIEDHLKKQTFPGVEVLVAEKDTVYLHKTWGYSSFLKNKELTVNSLFDLASLTKILATSLAVMKLVQDNILELNTSMALLLPEWETGTRESITVLQLLTHTSGLPAWLNLEESGEPQKALNKIMEAPLECRPGEKVIYSCMGFILLSEIVRRITGQSLKDFCIQEIYPSLEITSGLYFSPVDHLLKSIPTEVLPGYPEGLSNLVHDENCQVFNGDAGNAGLFGNIETVFHLLRKLLDIFHGRSFEFFYPETIRQMWRNHLKIKPARALGWDYNLKNQGYMSCGTKMPEGAVGHTGFTGTSIWMDPESERMILVFSNRVNIHRTSNLAAMGEFRANIHDLIMENLFGIKQI